MNSVNLIGRLTRDPEQRATASGTDVCGMRIAIDRQAEGADYVDVTAFGKLAEVCAQYLEKGRQVGLTGRLHYSEWEAEDGSKRSRHEVIAQSVQFLAGSGAESTAEGHPEPVTAAAQEGTPS
jgi:single-strand DNA-binding protein